MRRSRSAKRGSVRSDSKGSCRDLVGLDSPDYVTAYCFEYCALRYLLQWET